MGDASGIVSTSRSPFGRQLRKDFLFDDDYINLNHGSFGTYPRPIQQSLHHWQDRHEARPDQFIRYDYPKLVAESRAAMASYLNAPIETLVFVPNATTGVNTVLRNLVFEPGDKILYFATIYGSCELTVKYITETTPAEAVKIEYTYPVPDDFFIQALKDAVKKEEEAGHKVKVAIFDSVVSLPGVRMPFERLTEACRELGVLSLLDAAHGVGHVDIDLEKLNPDFFVSNCHKWLYVPRGCAIFHVPLRNQHLIRSTLPTSHGFKPYPKPGETFINPLPPSTQSPFITNFTFVGTIDSSPYLCIKDALAYRVSLGGEKAIREYCFALARRGGQRAAEILGTKVLENEEGTLGECCFSNVLLPLDLSKCEALAKQKGKDKTGVPVLVKTWISKVMVDDYDTFLALIEYGGGWWARLSAQVYLEVADFEWAADVLKKICERALQGEFLE